MWKRCQFCIWFAISQHCNGRGLKPLVLHDFVCQVKKKNVSYHCRQLGTYLNFVVLCCYSRWSQKWSICSWGGLKRLNSLSKISVLWKLVWIISPWFCFTTLTSQELLLLEFNIVYSCVPSHFSIFPTELSGSLVNN